MGRHAHSMLGDPAQDPEAVRWEFLVGYYSLQAAPHVRDYLDYMSDTAANATVQTEHRFLFGAICFLKPKREDLICQDRL